MEGILEVNEACKFLKMSKVTLYRHVRKGIIPAFKVGGSWKFNKISLDDWIQKRVKEDTAARSLNSTNIKTNSIPKQIQMEKSILIKRRKK